MNPNHFQLNNKHNNVNLGSDQKEDKCFDIKLPKIKIDLPLVTIQKKIEHLALMPVSETHNLPLSTSQIFKVKVFPTTLHFGKVKI